MPRTFLPALLLFASVAMAGPVTRPDGGAVRPPRRGIHAQAGLVAQPDEVRIHRGQKARVEVLANDTGAFDPATVEIVEAPQYGTAVPDAAGRILYTHTTGTPDSDSFSYRVGGGAGVSDPAVVTVQFANELRVAPAGLHVPLDPPPPVQYGCSAAFDGLSFYMPTCMTSPPGETQRLFVGELTGTIRMIPDVTASPATASVFLDLPAVLATRVGETLDNGPYYEDGLLGLAFHPAYPQNGYFFVFYTVRKDDGFYYQRVARFHVDAGNPNAADPDSELVLIEQLDEERNHNAGDLHFGPDGYLYFPMGDEGEQYDFHQNSQRIDLDFFSGMFRIDVDKRPGNLEPNPHAAVPLDNGVARFSVPVDNPFVGATSYNGLPVDPAAVRTEFWATGLRSPWRFSFDAATGDLWCGDVGQDRYEEVNLITRGGNYGWIYRDGAHEGYRTPPVGFDATLIDPLYEYVHTNFAGDPKFEGNSVIGGVVYRGSRFVGLAGAYIFGDWLSGNIWALRRNGAAVTVEWLAAQDRISAFGVDPSNGDVLVVGDPYGPSPIYRITTVAPTAAYPEALSETGLFADLTDLSPNPGVLPYEPNVSFWSDYATKRRWFAVPEGASLGWAREGGWTLPEGMLWVKHFDLETERGNPATKRRIETRVLVKNAAGVYGVSYRWNDAQTDATLAPAEGVEFPIEVVEAGAPRTQTWRIPSRTDCQSCHNTAGGYALSFNTRQLNRALEIDGFAGNAIGLLNGGGFFTNAPDSTQLLPRHVRADETEFSVEQRVRSYLAVNCANCHQPGGGGPPTWDGRAELTLAQTSLIDGTAANNGGNEENKLIVPGAPAHSIVFGRVTGAAGFPRMPPIASNEIDPSGSALLAEWIGTALPGRQTYEQWRAGWFGADPTPEGEPGSDPDGDAEINSAEFIAGTNPTVGAGRVAPSLSVDGQAVVLQIEAPPDRIFQVEESSDLVEWHLWDVPGNDGLGRPGGVISLSGPVIGGQQFFRVRLWEP